MNADSDGVCKSCGEAPKPNGAQPPLERRPVKESRVVQSASQTIHHHDIARKWKFEYAFGAPDETSRGLEVISTLLSHLEKPHIDLRMLLNETAALISKQFGIREVTIGLRDKKDGLFRYVAVVGIRAEAEAALRRVAYTIEDFRPEGRYKGTSLGKYTSLFLAEDNPYVNGEEITYSHPVLLGSRRKSLTDSVEGDYIDVMIFGKSDEAVGWIEIAGTRAGKIPDINTIRWMEAISRIIAVAIICKEYREVTR
jgi:hypothetical protein